MKIKAKSSYKKLDHTKNYISLGSTSTHLLLMANQSVEIKGNIPDNLKEHLTETKNIKGGKK